MDNDEVTQNQNVGQMHETPRMDEVKTASIRKLQLGPIIGSIIIVILLIFGGLYFIGKKVSEEGLLAPANNLQAIQSASDNALLKLEEQSTSDEVNAISNDLDATTLDDLDTELKNIESELGL